MRKFNYYLTLALYPLVFFAILGGIQYAILARSFDAQEERREQPYLNGQPLPEVTVKVDRRPQSINIP